MRDRTRQRGTALILMVLLGVALIVLSVASVQMTLAQSTEQRGQSFHFTAGLIAESGAAQAIARIKEGGLVAPHSGTGEDPAWITFSEGQYLYRAERDPLTEITTVRAWGRLAIDDNPSSSTLAPDQPGFDGSGWYVRGIEFTLLGGVYVPTSPLYFGNGGIEKPLGGFAWTGSSDPSDPSTWGTVTSSPASWQTDSVPFVASALDHPVDHLYGSTSGPAPATTTPHPYNIWATQNPIGQRNIEAWFANSAGSSDPTSGLTPPPTAPYFDTSDQTSPDYPYPVDPDVPDVQSFAWKLWDNYKDDPATTHLASGSHSGTFGDLTNPGVTMVTGRLNVPAGQTFKGSGVLVIRDDFDPNSDSNNRPSNKADLTVSGTLEWTGLVIVAGWAPTLDVRSGGDVKIVGALFGEDSVQSGGEISLDSATIIIKAQDDTQVLYSAGLFAPGGVVRPFLPAVKQKVIGVKEL